MTFKTQLEAPKNTQEIFITRTFEIPLEDLFEAFVLPELFEAWMGTNVIHLNAIQHGSYAFETSHQGKVMLRAHGVFHDVIKNAQIVRTFEMEEQIFPAQFEILNFEKISEESSKLSMHIVFQSIYYRDEMLKLPFSYGLNMAHERLEELLNNKNKK
ncbi:MAG TPA: SRPBCC domain-containing protein [Bacteroidia bacterium]|nr:SRPBCC domain-containing protein [Bacteroidia bacterium]